ncbi:MAG: hypothetical protein AAGG01_16595, partial [Planctomycetota bacterium]
MGSPTSFVALALCLTATASAQTNRSVQIRSVDFDRGLIEVFNFGTADADLSGWRFCSFDQNDSFVYSGSGGLSGVSVEAGTSLFVHFNDDAPAGDADRINRSDVGSFATPLSSEAWGLALFDPPAGGSVSFGNSGQMADYVQWNRRGASNGNASTRAGQAVSQGLWTARTDFVSTTVGTGRIDLTDGDGGLAHGPGTYFALGATVFDEAGGLDASDDRLSPTGIALVANSSSTVVLNQQGDAFGRDIDYVTFDVPAGQRLARLTLDAFIADAGNQGFLGMQAGSIFTTDAASTSPADLLGGVIYGAQLTGTDLLPQMAQLGAGFSIPLDEGSYTLWFNQTGPRSEAVLTFDLEDASVGSPYCGPAVSNSTGVPTLLLGAGSASVATNDLILQGSSLPQNSLALAIASRTQGFVQSPGTSVGNLCLGGAIGRFVGQASSSGATGTVSVSVDLTAIPQPNGPASAAAGESWSFQLWHR